MDFTAVKTEPTQAHEIRRIAGETALASIGYGQGRVLLIGFRTQNRAQTHGTYEFPFNSLLTPAVERRRGRMSQQ